MPRLNRSARWTFLLVLLSLLTGCSINAGPVKATWQYSELVKDEDGLIKEVGSRRVLTSGGDEMYEIQGKSLEVITVTSAKARFRFSSGNPKMTEEAELQPGSSTDLWLDSIGVRLRVDKIGSIN